MVWFKHSLCFSKIESSIIPSLHQWQTDIMNNWKIEVSSAKGLTADDWFSDRSLIYTKNDRGHKIFDGMLTSAGDHDSDWPFNKTLWNLFVRKLSRHFSGRPNIPKDCSLLIRPSCQIQSNALDMSKNIPLT